MVQAYMFLLIKGNANFAFTINWGAGGGKGGSRRIVDRTSGKPFDLAHIDENVPQLRVLPFECDGFSRAKPIEFKKHKHYCASQHRGFIFCYGRAAI